MFGGGGQDVTDLRSRSSRVAITLLVLEDLKGYRGLLAIPPLFRKSD